MHALQAKVRAIYLPYLAIAAGCVTVYSFLNWFLLIKTELLSLDEDVVNFALPMGIPWVPMLVWLRPRLKALRLTAGNGNLPFVYLVVAALAIAAPTILAQHYLATATGSITHLNEISEINSRPKTKYYSLRQAQPDKSNASVESIVTSSGKYNQHLDVNVYFVCPLADLDTATTRRVVAWLGTSYRQQISNRAQNDQQRGRIRGIVQSFIDEYRQADLSRFTYLERTRQGDAQRGFHAAIAKSAYHEPDSPATILIAHQEGFAERNGNKLAWVFGSFGIGAFVWLVMVLVAPVNTTQMDLLLAGKKLNNADLRAHVSFLLPRPGFLVTPILIHLNTSIFVGMVLSGLGLISFNRSDLLVLGANYGPKISNGEVWRLVTSMFLHGGVVHLIGNLTGLLLAGLFLESVLGATRLACCYFACGIGGGIASIAWHPETVSVGASGAIFGLWGILLGLSPFKVGHIPVGRNVVLVTALLFLGGNMLVGLTSSGIDNAGHLGGLLCGISIGILGGFFPGLLRQFQGNSETP